MKNNSLKGFTLIEIMVALAILAIMTMIALPSFQQSMTTNRLLSETNAASGVIDYARSEAARRNSYVSICPSLDGQHCNSTDISNGAVVYSDPALQGLVNSNQIIKTYDSWGTGSDKGKLVMDNGSTVMTFTGALSVISPGTILVCHVGQPSYSISVNLIGSTTTASNSNDGGC